MNVRIKPTVLVQEHGDMNESKLDLTATATDDFSARSPDELSMAKGDRIELIERDDEFNDGWYLGRHQPTGRTGLFPQGQQAHSVR